MKWTSGRIENNNNNNNIKKRTQTQNAHKQKAKIYQKNGNVKLAFTRVVHILCALLLDIFIDCRYHFWVLCCSCIPYWHLFVVDFPLAFYRFVGSLSINCYICISYSHAPRPGDGHSSKWTFRNSSFDILHMNNTYYTCAPNWAGVSVSTDINTVNQWNSFALKQVLVSTSVDTLIPLWMGAHV